MSVLYKALQKAAKDNEERQAHASFDAERLAGSGVIRSGGSRRVSWRIAGAVVMVVFVAIMGAGLYLTSSSPTPPPKMQTVALAPPQRPAPAAPAPVAAAPPASETTAPATAAPDAAAVAPPAPVAAPAAVSPEPQEPAADAEVAGEAPAPAEPAVAAAPPAETRVASRPRATPPMPEIAPDSPTRMLSPPITIHRSQMDLAGVGNAVQVRRVSQEAQNTVATAYNALVRGEYDTALGFYDQALQGEPTSVLALLGRGTALQKLGRRDEARQSYERVLKINTGNREALTNLTALEGERAPSEAVSRLIDLERQYPYFSPIKAQIGLIYARLGNLDGALDYLRRALVVTPDAPLYIYNVALVLDRMGNAEQAALAYEHALEVMGKGRGNFDVPVTDIQRRVTFLRGH